ncbi:uncharacterized protein B0I36DRAFT_312311 [Microdochium trichocladiopsis]|uniref:Uncharacterized protein n=1 Tax=Microdochium trichocladiopsis TaxID=1682393 RepID=A0A9P8YLG6_9PEZI|nr:uncharacterized protein B0I36DRAFT_312311 [Microdochium trichocladiopsis]KAH7041184.1 hypothetical protein B0I36DRAFT_312311 [Microdochium trichocladiopsis]
MATSSGNNTNTKGSSSHLEATSRGALLAAAQSFCDAFAQKATPPAELVSKFFASSPDTTSTTSTTTTKNRAAAEILVLEHGLVNLPANSRAKQLLPFLGRPFRGHDGVRRYFEAVGRVLDYRDMRFHVRPGDEVEEGCGGLSPFVVDVEGRQVCVKGRARFQSKETGQEWDESFIYKLGYVFEGGGEEEGRRGWKVLRLEIWADPAAAYLAARGEL